MALRNRPLEFLNAQRGQGDIVVFRLGPRRSYLVNHPDLVRQLLTTRRSDFIKGGPLIDFGRVLAGNGLIGSEGELHRKQRRRIQPAFHPSRFPDYVTIMQETAAAKAAAWQENELLALDQEMHDLSTTVLGRCLYSGRLSDEMINEIARLVPAALEGLGRRIALPFRWLHALPTPRNRRFSRTVEQLHRVVDRIIADCRTSGTDQPDVVSLLLNARDEDTGEAMSDQQIHDEIMTILIAGSETTAVAMSWAWQVIATEPGVEQQIHDELRRVLGGRPITHPDLRTLDYLGRVVTEILRVYPPAWLVPRLAAADTELGGHPIGRGSYVFYSPYANHHDPLLFPEPERFDPDRWLPERSQHLPRCAYLPFAAGTRRCVGDTFALAEVTVALATITARWRLRPHPDHPVHPQPFTVLNPGQLRLIAERRT